MKHLIVKPALIKIMICLSLAFMLNLFQVQNNVTAQNVSVNVHVPVWAPHYEYTERVRYYYMPDIESYYDINRQQFVYFQNGVWVNTAGLPPAYATYDINNAYVVVLDYNVHDPWRNHRLYRVHYPRYYYRTVYKTTVINNTSIRGYNENVKTVVYNNNHKTTVVNNNKTVVNNKSTVVNNSNNATGKSTGNNGKVKPEQNKEEHNTMQQKPQKPHNSSKGHNEGKGKR